MKRIQYVGCNCHYCCNVHHTFHLHCKHINLLFTENILFNHVPDKNSFERIKKSLWRGNISSDSLSSSVCCSNTSDYFQPGVVFVSNVAKGISPGCSHGACVNSIITGKQLKHTVAIVHTHWNASSSYFWPETSLYHNISVTLSTSGKVCYVIWSDF